jgi:hypothetical protein
MRVSSPHALSLLAEYTISGLGCYLLLIGFLCRFLAFGEESDALMKGGQSRRDSRRASPSYWPGFRGLAEMLFFQKD